MSVFPEDGGLVSEVQYCCRLGVKLCGLAGAPAAAIDLGESEGRPHQLKAQSKRVF